MAQPINKKLNGKYLEQLGIWAPHKRKTVMRHIALNRHRLRYWLMVGAEPTKGVQRLIEKFDFTPKRHDPFGSPHKYKKPDQVMCYRNGSYRGEPFKLNANDRKVEWYYRQKL